MIIRCERCSTLYELDESLLAPDGSEVQCTRCQHVFRARPPRAPGQTLQGVPSPEPAAAIAEPARPSAAPAPPPEVPAPEAAPAPESRGFVASASHQPARYTPGAPYRPPTSQPSGPRGPLIRRDTVGTFESRLRWSHRWRWLAPTAFAAVVGLVVAFLLRETLIDPRGREGHRAALELAYRDDVASLEQARARLDETIRTAPRLHAAVADRALVELLLVGAAGQAPDRTSAGVAARQASASAAQATAALEQLESARLAPGEVARARAVAAALASDRAALERFAASARGRLGADPLLQAVEQGVDATSADRAVRERAMGALSKLVKDHPEVIRARFALARGQALSGRRTEALATLEVLLAANPRHEGALVLKETLLHSAPVPGGPAPGGPPGTGILPQAAARGEKSAASPRKPDSTAGEAGGAAASGAAESASARTPPSRPVARPGQEAPPAAGAPDGAAGGGDRAPGELEPPPLAPRLRPAAVPEPEPVQGGG